MRAPTSFHELRAAQAAEVVNDLSKTTAQDQGNGKEPLDSPRSTELPEPEPYRAANHPSEWKGPWSGWSQDPTYEAQSKSAITTAARANELLNARRSDNFEKRADLDQYEEQSQPDNNLESLDEKAIVKEFDDIFSEMDQQMNYQPEIKDPRGMDRPYYVSLKVEQSQAEITEHSVSDEKKQSEPRFFSERHPPSPGHDIER